MSSPTLFISESVGLTTVKNYLGTIDYIKICDIIA